jgi:hypothetical protein
MKVISRVAVLAFLAVALAQIGVPSASGDTKVRAPLHYVGRADQRLCPSPMCGGIWLQAVNGAKPRCRAPVGGGCYVTGLSFPEPSPDERRRARLTALVANGHGLVQGRITPAHIEGFPELRALHVEGIWRAAGTGSPNGVVRLLRDNGVRCVRQPCFSTQAGALNRDTAVNVSSVDLSRTGASSAERRWARKLLATRHLIAAGRIVREADGGRTFVATRLYFRAY